MNTMQMLLVLIAALMFSTVLLSMYNGLSTQTDLGREVMYRNQASRLVDRYMQRIEAEFASGSINFDSIRSTWNNFSNTVVLNGVSYAVSLRVDKCNEAGSISSPTNSYLRVGGWAVCNLSRNQVITVGSRNTPIIKIIADKGL